jgi:hypothetical protein
VLFFYRRWPQWFAPKRVCSWCPAVIKRGGIFSRGKVSHGICGDCSRLAMKCVRENLPHHHLEWHGLQLAVLFFISIGLSAGCERVEPPSAPYRPLMHAAVDVATPPETRMANVEVIP